jgi:hypothetical protein
VPPVKYEMGLSIPEDDILHSHRRESLKFYIAESGSFGRANLPVQLQEVTMGAVASLPLCEC